MICKYYLTIGKVRKEIPSEDFKNWDEVEYSMSRKDFSGIVRSFSSKFEFVGNTAERITDEFHERGLYAEGLLDVFVVENDWTYTKAFSCPLYFASYEAEEGFIKIQTLDNSLAAIIKANKGKTYEYLMSEISDGKSIPFFYEGIELDNVVNFKLGPDANSSNISEFTTLKDEYQKLPLKMVSEEIIGNENIKWNQEQTPEAFEVKSREEMIELPNVLPSDHGFPYGSYTNGNNYLVSNFYADGETHPIIRVVVNAEFNLQLPSGVTADDLELWITTSVITGDVINYSNSNETVSYWNFKVEEGTTNYFLHNVKLVLHPNYRLMLFARIRKSKEIKVRVLSSSLQVTWTGKYSSAYMDYVKPETLLNKLVESMVDSRRKVTCSIDVCEGDVDPSSFSYLGYWDTDTRLKNTILIPMDTITNNPSKLTYLRTSFNDFCEWMEAVFGYVYVIEGDNLIFCHRTKLFKDYENGKEINNISDVIYNVSREAIFSSLEVGYDNTEDNGFNMKYEFNRKMMYDTGIVNTDKKKTLLSPYRADSIGFELAYESGINTASDDKNSQDGLWFIYVKDDIIKSRQLKTVSQGVGSVTGDKKGMFNFVFSPIYNLKANSYFISSFVRQLKLTSSNINNVRFYVNIGQISVKRDFYASKDDCNFFNNPLFTIGEMSFETDDQNAPSDFSLPVSVVWNGLRYKGYILSIDAKFECEKSCKYQIIVKQIEKI